MRNGISSVAFVGLGKMGGGMIARILDAGYEVRAFDVAHEALELAAARGAVACESPAEAVRSVEAVILMLPDSDVVERVLFGDGGISAGAADGTVVVDMSSGDALKSRGFAQSLLEQNVQFLDAPVSGGIPAASNGSLTIMVGGDDSVLERVRELLGAMGKRIVHTGPVGSGHALKSLNNALYAISLISSSEALIVAKKLGIDPRVAVDVFTSSSGTNRALETRIQTHVMSRDFEGAMSTALMTKDLSYACRLASDAGVATSFMESAHAEFKEYMAQGCGQEVDFGIARMYEDRAGVVITSGGESGL